MYKERINAAVVAQRWEYLCELGDDLEQLGAKLKHAGEQRWELVNVITIGGALTAFLKRPSTPSLTRHDSDFQEESEVSKKAK